MRKFDLNNDTFAPELEKWRVWVDGYEETGREITGRTAALRFVAVLRRNWPKLFEDGTPTIRMKIVHSVPF